MRSAAASSMYTVNRFTLSSEFTRMQLQRFALLSLVGFAVTACSSDTGPTTNTPGATASVRYINAIPDTNATDFKFVDQVNGSPYYGQLNFEDISAYQAVAVGARHIRIFSVDPAVTSGAANEGNISVVSQVFVDTTLTFEANKFYTIIHVGYARTGSSPKQHLIVITDDQSSPPSSSQIAVRVVNAAPTIASADIYGASTASGSPMFPGVAFGTASNYKILSLGTLTFAATASGSTTVAASAAAPAGAPPASISQSALGGYSVGGSMLTAFIFPPSVTGSLATKSANPTVKWIQDNFPDMPTGK